MADRSKIEWTDASINPIRARNLKTGKVGWHCEHATTGCEFCYSEGFNKRLGTGLPFKPGHRKDVEIFLDEEMLTQPLRWKKPRRIFVCSMTDAFADFVTDEMLDKMFAVAALCPQHTLQFLTKRADRMKRYLSDPATPYRIARACLDLAIADKAKWTCDPWPVRSIGDDIDMPDDVTMERWPLPNVWLGVSAERQQEADERIPELLATPAAVRFVSLEPLLGHISLHALNLVTPTPCDALRGVQCVPDDSADGFHNEPMAKLDWVIAGGESGSHARSMHPDWSRSLRDWCDATGVPFFFKQWGEWAPSTPEEANGNPRSGWMASAAHPQIAKASELYPEAGAKFVARVGKKSAGRLLDGVEHNGMPLREMVP